MRVLFLALGNHRQTAVIDEARSVLQGGGAALVLVGDLSKWEGGAFPEGAEVVDLSDLERDHLPLRIEQKIVFGIPRRLLKVVGRGRLRRPSKRAWGAYERRFAKPVHRRAMDRYKQIWHERRHALTMTYVNARDLDYINPTDYLSIPVAGRILSDLESASKKSPSIIFGVDFVK